MPKDCGVHLFWPNIQVDEFNNRKLREKKTNHFLNLANDVVVGKCSEKTRNYLKSSAMKLGKTKTNNLVWSLELKV